MATGTGATKAPKAPTKSAILAGIAETTGLSRKQVGEVFDALTQQIQDALGKKGEGVFILPGIVKIRRETKPATKGGERDNPFKPGEKMMVKAKPERNVIKTRPLKLLKDMV